MKWIVRVFSSLSDYICIISFYKQFKYADIFFFQLNIDKFSEYLVILDLTKY